MRKPQPGASRRPQHLFTITCVGLLLLIGVLGFGGRKPHTSAHAPVVTPAGHVEPVADPDAGHRVQPRPTSVRNG